MTSSVSSIPINFSKCYSWQIYWLFHDCDWNPILLCIINPCFRISLPSVQKYLLSILCLALLSRFLWHTLVLEHLRWSWISQVIKEISCFERVGTSLDGIKKVVLSFVVLSTENEMRTVVISVDQVILPGRLLGMGPAKPSRLVGSLIGKVCSRSWHVGERQGRSLKLTLEIMLDVWSASGFG
jgi:hypothetical protein